MVERIRALLAWQQLSPTQFADRIGVGRPVLSHILSERNKPSLEVMRQIRRAFPELSLLWLLEGEGEMLENTGSQVNSPELAAPPAPTSVPQAASATPRRQVATATAPISAASPPAAAPRQSARPAWAGPPRFVAAQPTPPATPAPAVAGPAAATAAPPAMATAPEMPQLTSSAPTHDTQPPAPEPALALLLDKKIRRIVIFYQDGSFADYTPEG